MRHAVRERISLGHVLWTPAAGSVVLSVAVGIACARRTSSVGDARVDAASVHAGSVAGAVLTGAALGALAPVEWIAFEAWVALAQGAVVCGVAFGIQGARVGQQARVEALAIVALLVVRALAVRLATD